MTQPTLLEAALSYHDRGWCVIPCWPRGKKPMVSWEKYERERPSREQVVAWWTRSPNANIALICGAISGVVAVDVDVYKGGDPKKVHDRAPTDLISRTPRGGFHLLYDHPGAHVPNKAPTEQSSRHGLDVRGDGGYVILPPSVGANGKRYQWRREGRPGPQFPRWVLGEKDADNFDAEEDGKDETGNRWLTTLLSGCEEGGRNAACARLAGYFAGKGVVQDVAILALLDWNRRNKPPLPIEELETTVRSVYSGDQRRHRTAANGKAPKFNLTDLGAYMTRHGQARIQWDIEEWLPSETIGFIVAAPEAYKTWLLLDLAVSVASGRPFLGKYPVREPGPVIVVQQEDFHGQIAERLATIANSRLGLAVDDSDPEVFHSPATPDLPIYFHEDRLLRFDRPESVAGLEERVAKIRPRVVLVDPLYTVGSVDDYMARLAEQMSPLKRMRDQYGCSFMVAHHTKKSAQGIERQDLWGSQFLNAFLESGWQVRKEGQVSVLVRRHFKVKGAGKDLKLTFDISTEYPSHYRVEAEEGDFAEGSDIVQAIEKFGSMTMSELSLKLGVHRSTISRKITPLVETGMLIKGDKGKFSIPDLPEM